VYRAGTVPIIIKNVSTRQGQGDTWSGGRNAPHGKVATAHQVPYSLSAITAVLWIRIQWGPWSYPDPDSQSGSAGCSLLRAEGFVSSLDISK
jgi:hypothetical protein